jgi:hypothetical protein
MVLRGVPGMTGFAGSLQRPNPSSEGGGGGRTPACADAPCDPCPTLVFRRGSGEEARL